MPIRNHIENYLRQLFQKAYKEQKDNILAALVPLENERFDGHATIPFGYKDEISELNAFIKQYHGLEPFFKENKQSLSRNRLLTYTHILESDFLYLVLLNLLLLIYQKPLSWTFYEIESDGEIKLNKKGEKILCSKPLKRIMILKQLCEKLELKAHEIFTALWKNELRNAFSHSQYFIDLNGSVILTKHLIHDIKVTKWKPEFMILEAKALEDLNENAILLFEKFIKIYQEFAYPFQSTGTHLIGKYPIIWDDQRKWWTFDYEYKV